MEGSQIYTTSSPDVSVKILAVEFYKKLTSTLTSACMEEEGSKQYNNYMKNFWVLLWCYWGAISFNSRISNEDRKNINEMLKKEPYTFYEARDMLYAVFEKSAKAGIFVDFNLFIADYDEW